MMDRERSRASNSEAKIPEVWIGEEVMVETTEALSSICVPLPLYIWRMSTIGAS
jgi:hypothetical protein